MTRLWLALLSCSMAPCQASSPEPRRADPSGALDDDVATADARPKNCLNTVVDGKRKVICCPRDEAYDVATQRCVVPPVRRSPPPEPPPLRFTERMQELVACKEGRWPGPHARARSHGRCADGKRFFEQNGFLSGWAELYRGEQWVGVSTWTDVTHDTSDGDTRCVVVERIALCGTPLHLFGRTVLP